MIESFRMYDIDVHMRRRSVYFHDVRIGMNTTLFLFKIYYTKNVKIDRYFHNFRSIYI